MRFCREVLLPDARNHGRSAHVHAHTYCDLASDLRSLVLGENAKATLLGHSMGARTVMLLCLLEPSLVSRAVVVDASPISGTPEGGIRLLNLFFRALRSVNFAKVGPGASLATAKEAVDRQLGRLGINATSRHWLTLNIEKDEARGR